MELKCFPCILKSAEITPVYKKENNPKRDNYRPVSILTVISKLYETVLNTQMVDYVYALFNELLAAFRKSYSCQTLLIKFIEDLKFALDKGHKMFDYLKDRKQRVKILNHQSSWKELTKGVPQGSILGPFLFNVFINDLFLFIENCKLYNYADDNSLMYSSPDLNCIFTNLQIDCKNAIDWLTVNGIKANPSKFQFMVISSERIEQKCLDIENGITLQSEPSVKVLGVTIDDLLRFNEHISACC